MISALISALVMSFTMWLIARHEADTSLVRTFLIAFGVTIITAFSSYFLGILALLVGFGLAAWAVRQFCYLRWPHAFIVATVFIVVRFGTAITFSGPSR
ncbi:hypothetical protein OKA04_01785 [Luteolibacter flavescens]|uniref:Uncharacterized protein n=1 Tax=Luteolibacter flavescens TaxID=1859460 RepID=A0ABT3FIQ3_9BACT|nr:hypothetical protein [Luteolibacter flavescens]MCW1883440.1 hypothetical protein [Luteolibacter flavescens]